MFLIFISTRHNLVPYILEGLCGKTMGILLFEADVVEKKTKLLVCASFKWINPSKPERKTSVWQQPHIHIQRHTYLSFSLPSAQSQGLKIVRNKHLFRLKLTSERKKERLLASKSPSLDTGCIKVPWGEKKLQKRDS